MKKITIIISVFLILLMMFIQNVYATPSAIEYKGTPTESSYVSSSKERGLSDNEVMELLARTAQAALTIVAIILAIIGFKISNNPRARILFSLIMIACVVIAVIIQFSCF